MLKTRLIALALALGTLACSAEAFAGGPRVRAEKIAWYHAQQRPWHGPYSNTEYGTPLALVVPPTAHMQSSYSWGVSQTEIRPIYHQFGRHYEPNVVEGFSSPNFLPTPVWPSHTDQFGIYYIRGPY